jgi:hypothetical protein
MTTVEKAIKLRALREELKELNRTIGDHGLMQAGAHIEHAIESLATEIGRDIIKGGGR